jgi:hypothetical protein
MYLFLSSVFIIDQWSRNVQENSIAGHENIMLMQELCNIGTIRTFHWSFL